jgi:hypothetical protein
MALQQLQIWTNEITNDTLTFNPAVIGAGFPNVLNIIELSINLKSGTGRFAGFYALTALGLPYATPNYINLTVGQPITITSNFNFPVGGCVIDCTSGGVIQVIATHIGDVYP